MYSGWILINYLTWICKLRDLYVILVLAHDMKYNSMCNGFLSWWVRGYALKILFQVTMLQITCIFIYKLIFKFTLSIFWHNSLYKFQRFRWSEFSKYPRVKSQLYVKSENLKLTCMFIIVCSFCLFFIFCFENDKDWKPFVYIYHFCHCWKHVWKKGQHAKNSSVVYLTKKYIAE